VTLQSAKIVKGGRLILPAEFRRQLDLKDGDTVVIEMDRDELHIRSQRAAIRRLQETVARYIPEGVSLVDELIAERRAESAGE
jgi:AbrB family looped-hinge helix DNA binding protein